MHNACFALQRRVASWRVRVCIRLRYQCQAMNHLRRDHFGNDPARRSNQRGIAFRQGPVRKRQCVLETGARVFCGVGPQ